MSKGLGKIQETADEAKKLEETFKRIEKLLDEGSFKEAKNVMKEMLEENVELAEKLNDLENKRKNNAEDFLKVLKLIISSNGDPKKIATGLMDPDMLEISRKRTVEYFEEFEIGQDLANGFFDILNGSLEALPRLASKLPSIINPILRGFEDVNRTVTVQKAAQKGESPVAVLWESYVKEWDKLVEDFSRGYNRGAEESATQLFENLKAVANDQFDLNKDTSNKIVATEKKTALTIKDIHYDANEAALVSEGEFQKQLKELAEAEAKKREEIFRQEKITLKEQLAGKLITKEEYAKAEEDLTIKYLENEIKIRKQFGLPSIDLEEQLADMRIAIKERETSEKIALLAKEKAAKETSIALEKKQLEVKTDTLKKLGESFNAFGKTWGTKWLAGTLSGVGNAFGKLSEIIKTKGEENKKNLETQSQSIAENADKQKSSFEGLMGKISEVSGYVSMATEAIVTATNEQLDRKIVEADEKIKAISAKYQEATEARKASDAELETLQAQAKNAQGEELAAIQTRIEAEKNKNKELTNQEKQFQKEKEKEEKRKEKLEKQKARNEMGQQIIRALADTASGIVKAVSAFPLTGGMPWAAIVAAQGALQVAAISKQMAKLEDGGLLRGRRHNEGGMPILGSNIEVEGGEYVVNRQSTGKNLGLLHYINSQRRPLSPADMDDFFASAGRRVQPSFATMLEEGGQLPAMLNTAQPDGYMLMDAIQSIKFEPKVSVTDINSAQSDVVRVDSWVGM